MKVSPSPTKLERRKTEGDADPNTVTFMPTETLIMKQSDEDRLRREREELRQWEELEARKKAEESDRLRREEEDKRRAEMEAKAKADAEARAQAIADAKRKYDESHKALLEMLERSAAADAAAARSQAQGHATEMDSLEVDDPVRREKKERLIKDVYMTDVGNPWACGDPGIENLFCEDGLDSKGRPVVAVNAIRVPFRRKDKAFGFLRYQLYPTVAQGKYSLVIYGSCSSTAVDSKLRIAGAFWSVMAMMKLPKIFKQNAKYIILVRPGLTLKVLLALVRLFKGAADGGPDFFSKLRVVDDAEEIAAVTGGDLRIEDTGSFRKFYTFTKDI